MKQLTLTSKDDGKVPT